MTTPPRTALNALAVAAAGLGLLWPGLPAPGPSEPGQAGAAVAQEEGPVTLRLRAGEPATYRLHSRTQIDPPPKMGMQTTSDATIVVRSTVREAGGDTLRMTSRVEDFQLELESGDEKMRSRLRQAAEESRKQMMGRTFRITLTRRGEVVDAETGEDGTESGPALDRTVRQLTFLRLPEDPVSVGDSWSSRRTSDPGTFGIPVDGQVVTETTATLARVYRRDGSRVAEISVESTFGFRPPEEDTGGMKVEMEGSSAKTVRFDLDAGRFLGASGAQDFTVNLAAPGQRQGTMTLQGTQETSAELVEG